jgi:HTH-type transcriptional regulator/antitoxin HigA
MYPRLIKTDEEYRQALSETERLIALDPAPGTRKADRLDLLAMLVEAYEKEKFPVDLPGPVEAIKFRMEEQGLRQKDLVPYFGTKSRVSEVLSGKRALTMKMARALHEGLGIPAAVLLQESGIDKQEEEEKGKRVRAG